MSCDVQPLDMDRIFCSEWHRVRRLASESSESNDVSLDRLFSEMIRDAGKLWEPFQHHFRIDLAKAYAEAAKGVSNDDKQCKVEACRRLISADRKLLRKATDKAIHFASKRVAHRNPTMPVHTTFNDLDQAVDMVKNLTEKYLLLVYDRNFDLLKDMKEKKLTKRWDEVFLIPWATPEILALPLGDIPPSRVPGRSRNT